jgi:hypothetical protein
MAETHIRTLRLSMAAVAVAAAAFAIIAGGTSAAATSPVEAAPPAIQDRPANVSRFEVESHAEGMKFAPKATDEL